MYSGKNKTKLAATKGSTPRKSSVKTLVPQMVSQEDEAKGSCDRVCSVNGSGDQANSVTAETRDGTPDVVSLSSPDRPLGQEASRKPPTQLQEIASLARMKLSKFALTSHDPVQSSSDTGSRVKRKRPGDRLMQPQAQSHSPKSDSGLLQEKDTCPSNRKEEDMDVSAKKPEDKENSLDVAPVEASSDECKTPKKKSRGAES